MDIVKMIKNLCTPAYVYLIISLVSTIILMIQNGGNDTKFCLGSFSCQVGSMSLFFLAQAIYTAIWVFILNWVCKSGYKDASWALVVFPYLLFFIALGILVYNSKPNRKKEGFAGLGGKSNNKKHKKDTDTDTDSDDGSLSKKQLKAAKKKCASQNGKTAVACMNTDYCYYDKEEGCIVDKKYTSSSGKGGGDSLF